MVKGYGGKVLFVDLTSGSIREESIPEKVYRDFIGGQGLGAKIIYDHVKPGADPLGPDNMIGFLVGPLSGTGVSGARYQVVGKSPITGGWGDCNSGGSLGSELKPAGYDGIFFNGISPKPVYLSLNNGKAELKDASHLWGKDTVETEEIIREEMGERRAKVVSIGPPGELMSLSAAIMHEQCAAARSGLAAVMGSKRLKAFGVRGTNKVPIADEKRLASLRKDYLQSVKKTSHPFTVGFKGGLCNFLSPSIISGTAPIKNWSMYGAEAFPTHSKISNDAVLKYQMERHACVGCPIGCKGWMNVDYGSFAVNRAGKPEYETLAMCGSNCLIDDVEAIIKINDLCNRWGLDTVSVGSAIAFAMECYERGVITKKDTDGIELTWGNAGAAVAMVEKIIWREGFGAVLADGSKWAAQHIGKGSEKWSMNVGGQDLPAHDGRAEPGFGWSYVCDPTPARHTALQVKVLHESGLPFATADELQLPKLDMLDIDANAPVFATSSDLDRLWTSAGLCIFGQPEPLPLVELMSAVTGWDFTLEEGLKAGRRIQTLRQAFNIREGVNINDWRLPDRMTTVVDSGPFAGRKLDFNAMKKKGYEALGLDSTTGKPLDTTLDELGLKELVGQLP
jgi:aldehyde:ferredoxin oxidoreductase